MTTYKRPYRLRAEFQGIAAGSGSTSGGNPGAPVVGANATSLGGYPISFPITPADGYTLTFAGSTGTWVATPDTDPVGANPTATGGPTAVNGSATTFMRSDASPAIQKASSSQFGIVEVDGTTITAAAGVISAAGATNPVTSAAVLTASALTQGDDGVRGIKTLANASAGQVLASGTPPAWTTSPALTAITLGGGSSLGQYVQGTWTPADGSGASLSITVNNAEYTVIGRITFFTMSLTYPVTANGSDALITLPTTPRSQIYLCLFQMSGGSTIEQGLIDGAFPGVKIDNPTTGVYLTNAQLSGKTFFITGSYNT